MYEKYAAPGLFVSEPNDGDHSIKNSYVEDLQEAKLIWAMSEELEP